MKKLLYPKSQTDLGEYRIICEDAVIGKRPDYEAAEIAAKEHCKKYPNKHVYISQITGILFGTVEVVQVEEVEG